MNVSYHLTERDIELAIVKHCGLAGGDVHFYITRGDRPGEKPTISATVYPVKNKESEQP